MTPANHSKVIQRVLTPKNTCGACGKIALSGLSRGRLSPKFVNRVSLVCGTTKTREMNDLFPIPDRNEKKQHNVNSGVYLAQLDRLEAAIKATQPRKKNRIVFHYDNAISHVEKRAIQSINDEGYRAFLSTLRFLPLTILSIDRKIGLHTSSSMIWTVSSLTLKHGLHPKIAILLHMESVFCQTNGSSV